MLTRLSHRLSNSFEGALAGGGDPASSPLYVFGPFLKLIVVAGVAPVTFGASVWLVVLTVAVVSAMYRLVMAWVTDGSGGSGLTEEEFGGWAMKVNAAITVVEYTLTFLVSIAALVTFIADRYPPLDSAIFGLSYRTATAIVLSLIVGWLVNRGPKMAARSFGPATFGVLILLWAMVIASVWKSGLRLPAFHLVAFGRGYLHYTLSGYAHILALMTGIEVFANLVAAYEGTAARRSGMAFRSLLIIMSTTLVTMLVAGPSIREFSDPTNPNVSVFTQAMDKMLPYPLPYLGTLLGVIVLASAAAASAQGLQNLALGMRYRNYIPVFLGRRNRYGVADKPVWIEVGLASACYVIFGTRDETYLTLYAAGVFVLLSMTGWAATKRLARGLRGGMSAALWPGVAGVAIAALLTTGASTIIFIERFSQGVWAYFLLIPSLYAVFGYVRSRRGAPNALDDQLGRFYTGQYLLPFQRYGRPEDETNFESVAVALDGSSVAEYAIPVAELFPKKFGSALTLVPFSDSESPDRKEMDAYLRRICWQMRQSGLSPKISDGSTAGLESLVQVSQDPGVTLIVLATRAHSTIERWFHASLERIVPQTTTPLLMLRPTEDWRSRSTQLRRLLVCLDGSEAAEQVLRYARAFGKPFESELLVLAVAEMEQETARLREYVDKVVKALRGLGLNAKCIVVDPAPAAAIIAIAKEHDSDLILMATRGRGSAHERAAVGNVLEEVMRSAPCPLLIVPASAQISDR